MDNKYEEVLTADLGGGAEGLGDLGIHADHEVLLFDDLLVPDLNLLLHPLVEVGPNHGGANVADPVLADLVDLLRVGHVVEHLRVEVVEVLRDVLEGKSLVLRHRNVLGVDIFDSCTKTK